ncbi:MAG: hypothetical protein Q9218_003574, partial [Villophora microphyllina]
MNTRRTLSADFQPQQKSEASSTSNYRKGQATGYTASSSCPGRSINDGGSPFGQHSKPFTPTAKVEETREHRTRLPLRTALPQKQPPNSPQQRQISAPSRRRSNRSPEFIHHGQSQATKPLVRREGPDCLWTASLDPPVTKETLSELDLYRIVADARLRHDVNFEHEIMFRPNTYGKCGEQKKQDGNRYFEALAFEFDLYFKIQRSRLASSTQPRSSPRPGKRHTACLSDAPRRLPRMISAIRDIVKTLVPIDKWQTVDEQFDVDLRMQELERGIGDIAGLIESLGRLLLDSCSPMRDSTVKDMVTRTQRAIAAEDAQELMHGIRDLFGVLETMKLDVANHQIRYLRFYLLDESIQYEQNHMLDRIASG